MKRHRPASLPVSGPSPVSVLLIMLPLAAIALSVPFQRIFGTLAAVREVWPAALAAALYGMSHVLRAIRLALLAAPALGMHIRTIMLLHFHTAPVSFAVPFKLGELYRWQQLAWLSANPLGSLIILLLDRTLDAVILLAVLGVAIALGGQLPPYTAALSGVLALATALGLFAVLVVPGCLETLQAYILQHHSAPRARRALRIIDSTRLMTRNAHDRLRGNVVLLLFLSAAIWALESAMLVVLAQQLNQETRMFLISLLTMTLAPQTAAWPPMAVVSLYSLVCLLTLLLIWPFATALYIMRIGNPRRRGPARTLSVHRTRRLHLRAAGRMS